MVNTPLCLCMSPCAYINAYACVVEKKKQKVKIYFEIFIMKIVGSIIIAITAVCSIFIDIASYFYMQFGTYYNSYLGGYVKF